MENVSQQSALRRCQLIQQQMLDLFVAICERHHLQYFLSYGTLLGAMRHKGAIPWDDDLDVAMLKRDYQKFLKVAPRELPPHILLQTPRSVPGAFEYFAKLRDQRTFFLEAHSACQAPNGVFIDIFPLVEFPDVSQRTRTVLAGGISYSWRKERKHRTMRHRYILGVFSSGLQAMFWRLMRMVLKVCVHVMCWFKATILLAAAEAGNRRYAYRKEDVFPLGEAEYDGKRYAVPHNPDAILTAFYGDWRQPPPENCRGGYHTRWIGLDGPIPSQWSFPPCGWRE